MKGGIKGVCEGRRSLKPQLTDVRGMPLWLWQLSRPLHRNRESSGLQRQLKLLLLLLAKVKDYYKCPSPLKSNS